MIRKLPRAFYERPTTDVARELLGKIVVRRERGRTLRGRIVEVEAYLGPRDRASHARFGPTPRAAIMFGRPGTLYVYLVYGMHHCMNVVTEAAGTAGAVLIRAVEPLVPLRHASSGPGNVCAALGVTRSDNGRDLLGAGLFIGDDGATPRLARSARIGVAYAGPWARRRLRFFVPGHPHVSGRPR